MFTNDLVKQLKKMSTGETPDTQVRESGEETNEIENHQPTQERKGTKSQKIREDFSGKLDEDGAFEEVIDYKDRSSLITDYGFSHTEAFLAILVCLYIPLSYLSILTILSISLCMDRQGALSKIVTSISSFSTILKEASIQWCLK
eukprot:Tbor_TRINITY_DN5488_c2_g4::TRINITY_DN5488_c2_g4_i1::g.24829::m.24829